MTVKNALTQIPETIGLMLKDYTIDLEEAWMSKEDDEGLSISFSAKLSIDSQGKNNCDVSISFVKAKVKDKVSFNWDERQGKLFEEVKNGGK